MKETFKRWLLIIAMSALVIWVGAGCRNIKTLEADFGGLDIEYYPSHPEQEQPSIFNWGITTNRLQPVLMDMDNGKYK